MKTKIYEYLNIIMINIDRQPLSLSHRKQFILLRNKLYDEKYTDEDILNIIKFYYEILENYSCDFNNKLPNIIDAVSLYYGLELKSYNKMMEKVNTLLESE